MTDPKKLIPPTPLEVEEISDEAVAAALNRYNRSAADHMTQHLRKTIAGLVEHARKKHGDAVAEDLLAWGKETNVEALEEWLGKTGWEGLEKNPAHADKVQDALTLAWSTTNPKRDYSVMILPSPGTAEGWTANNLDMIFKRISDGGDNVDVALAFPGIRNAPGAPTPTIDGKVPVIKAVLGMAALQVLFLLHDWTVVGSCVYDETELPKGDWLRLLAMPWATERAAALAERLERQKTAAALEDAPRVKVKGRDFRRVPKVLAGVSWAFGGSGVELSRVTVDGKEYAPAPDLAVQNPSALVPASYALLPEDHAKKAHQTLLPIDLQGGQDAPPLPVALAGATQYALAPAAGKLGLLVMAAAWAVKGKLHKTTLRDLTRAINPDAAKLVTSHFETVTRGLVQLDGLRLVLPNGMSYRVYECPIPWRELKPEEYDAPLFIGMTRTFEKTLAAISDMAGASYRGDFLFDLTGAMMLPTKRSGLLRQYIRSCAFWNSYWKPGTAGEPDPSRVPEVSAERWAAMTNYLPPAAVEYLRANGKDRFRLSHSIRDTIKDAEALAEAGLVKIAKANRQGVRLLPPPEYLEAWHESRKGAARMPGNAGGVK